MLEQENLSMIRNNSLNLFYTEGNKLSLQVQNFNFQQVILNSDAILLKTDIDTGQNINFILKDRITKEKIKFKYLKDGDFILQWKNFLNTHCFYDLMFEFFGYEYRVKMNSVPNLRESKVKYRNTHIDIYNTKSGNISLKSYSKLSNIINRVKLVLKSKK